MSSPKVLSFVLLQIPAAQTATYLLFSLYFVFIIYYGLRYKCVVFVFPQMSRSALNRDKKQASDSDIEKYAQDNLNIHKKGIFRKKFSVRDMLSWSKVNTNAFVLCFSFSELLKYYWCLIWVFK